jgi:hypothetical protein
LKPNRDPGLPFVGIVAQAFDAAGRRAEDVFGRPVAASTGSVRSARASDSLGRRVTQRNTTYHPTRRIRTAGNAASRIRERSPTSLVNTRSPPCRRRDDDGVDERRVRTARERLARELREGRAQHFDVDRIQGETGMTNDERGVLDGREAADRGDFEGDTEEVHRRVEDAARSPREFR